MRKGFLIAPHVSHRRCLTRRALPSAAALILLGGALAFVYRHAQAPPDYWPAVLQGRAELAGNRPYQALRTVAGVSGQGRGAGEAMTVAAQAFIQLDQREDARRALERALELEPNQPLAARLLAAIRIAAGDTDRGLADLTVAARLAPEDSRPWRAMGKVYFTRMQYDQSIHAYQEALKRNPKDAQARLDYLIVLLDQNLGELAAPYLTEALRDTPNDPRVLGLAARQAYAAGRPDDAVKLSERALERDSDNFDALIVLGRVELARGHWKSSMEHAQRAVAAQPNNVGALHLLAQAHFRLGQKELAAAAADRRDGVQSRRDSIAKLAMMIAYRPDDPKLHLLMGQLAVETGQSVLAEQSYRAALAIDPRSGPAASGLARLRARSAATSSAPHDQDGARLSSGFIANRRP